MIVHFSRKENKFMLEIEQVEMNKLIAGLGIACGFMEKHAIGELQNAHETILEFIRTLVYDKYRDWDIKE